MTPSTSPWSAAGTSSSPICGMPTRRSTFCEKNSPAQACVYKAKTYNKGSNRQPSGEGDCKMRRRLPIMVSLVLGSSLMVRALPSVRAQDTSPQWALSVFSVTAFGATGVKPENAREAIQKAGDACAEAGGGMVYLPPGEYTSGTIHLRSQVRFFIESGATLFASREKQEYDKEALFYGEDLMNITIEGRGLVDGQSEYEWRLNDLDDRFIRDNQLLMEAAGQPLPPPLPGA